MPTYRFRCGCGKPFEKFLASWSSPWPPCPECGVTDSLRKLPTAVGVIVSERPRSPRAKPPSSWEGTHGGNREYVTQWRRALEFRRERDAVAEGRKAEAVYAHEGAFARSPLTYRELAERTAAANGNDVTVARAEAIEARMNETKPSLRAIDQHEQTSTGKDPRKVRHGQV
jgi:putative FmdB family regulatory protein